MTESVSEETNASATPPSQEHVAQRAPAREVKKQQRQSDPQWLMKWKQDVDATHIIEKLELVSFPLRSVFEKRKTFDFANFCLHHILVKWAYRIGAEGHDVVTKQVQELFDKANKELDTALAMQEALYQAATKSGKKITLYAGNNAPVEVEAFVTNPHSMMYLDLFRKADLVIRGYDGLWMYSIVTLAEKNKGMLSVRRQINAIAMGIYALYKRARDSARHKNDIEEIDDVKVAEEATADIENDVAIALVDDADPSAALSTKAAKKKRSPSAANEDAGAELTPA